MDDGAPAAAIEVRDVVRTFVVRHRAGRLRRTRHSVRAVDGLSFTVGRGEHRFALAPVAVPGGAALSFSLVGQH